MTLAKKLSVPTHLRICPESQCLYFLFTASTSNFKQKQKQNRTQSGKSTLHLRLIEIEIKLDNDLNKIYSMEKRTTGSVDRNMTQSVAALFFGAYQISYQKLNCSDEIFDLFSPNCGVIHLISLALVAVLRGH